MLLPDTSLTERWLGPNLVKVYQQELFAAITEGVVLCAHLQLGATPSTSADDSAADASPQRHRGLGDHAENRLGPVQSACALTSE